MSRNVDDYKWYPGAPPPPNTDDETPPRIDPRLIAHWTRPLEKMDNTEESMLLVRILAKPVDVPWTPGNTLIVIALATTALAITFVWHWLPLVILVIVLLAGGVLRTQREEHNWEVEQVHWLQARLLWLIENRNVLARLTGYRYKGDFLDDNDPANWQKQYRGDPPAPVETEIAALRWWSTDIWGADEDWDADATNPMADMVEWWEEFGPERRADNDQRADMEG